ncbi:MAG: radical SAM family heme chaperone HemW [Pseudomonadales bacterium]|nr:radical SAM family heme chaperone HemW [Pseudomonadales bacterium]
MSSPPPTLPPLSLYIHVPWCVRKCPYCDFNSHQQSGELPEAAYIQALLDDLRMDLPYVQGRPLQSIFIGGGTPSLFSADAYARLLTAIADLLDFAPDIEITLEANPGTFEQKKFGDFRRTGINRLSIGVQSFNDVLLKKLGRIHNAGEALRAAAIAHEAGFGNFNLDLMFGLPGQSRQQALQDLENAVACKPRHISWYQLTLEPNTEFYRFPPALPDDDEIHEIHSAGQALLANRGFSRYEISAYARPGQQARHNLNYWQFGDYLGIGAGAHGKLTLAAGDIIRTRKTRQPGHYLDLHKVFTAETRSVAKSELPLEFMMNALRLSDGVPLQLFAARTGLALSQVQPALDQLQARGLLECNADNIRPSAKGLLFLNELLLAFM